MDETTDTDKEPRAMQAERMEGPRWKAQQAYLDRIVGDFIKGLLLGWTISTRSPTLVENHLVLREVDDVVQSAIAVKASVEEGMHNPAHRECRYILESMVQRLAVDQAMSAEPFVARLKYYSEHVERSDLANLDSLTLTMLPKEHRAEFRAAVQSEYKRLCGYVHPSTAQMQERVTRRLKGAHMGLETEAMFEKMNRDLFRVLDLALALYFHGVGPMAGDVFIHVLDDEVNWKFHKGKYTAMVSANFDYKAERKPQNQRTA